MVARIVRYVDKVNPVRASFLQWKNQVSSLGPNMEELVQSSAEKAELKQQCELINYQNEQIKQEVIRHIEDDHDTADSCEICFDAKVHKLEDATHMSYNVTTYNQIRSMVGISGIWELLG